MGSIIDESYLMCIIINIELPNLSRIPFYLDVFTLADRYLVLGVIGSTGTLSLHA